MRCQITTFISDHLIQIHPSFQCWQFLVLFILLMRCDLWGQCHILYSFLIIFVKSCLAIIYIKNVIINYQLSISIKSQIKKYRRITCHIFHVWWLLISTLRRSILKVFCVVAMILVALIGNVLVILSVVLNKSMRYFLLSLHLQYIASNWDAIPAPFITKIFTIKYS